jgi:hypothetical protein
MATVLKTVTARGAGRITRQALDIFGRNCGDLRVASAAFTSVDQARKVAYRLKPPDRALSGAQNSFTGLSRPNRVLRSVLRGVEGQILSAHSPRVVRFLLWAIAAAFKPRALAIAET